MVKPTEGLCTWRNMYLAYLVREPLRCMVRRPRGERGAALLTPTGHALGRAVEPTPECLRRRLGPGGFTDSCSARNATRSRRIGTKRVGRIIDFGAECATYCPFSIQLYFLLKASSFSGPMCSRYAAYAFV